MLPTINWDKLTTQAMPSRAVISRCNPPGSTTENNTPPPSKSVSKESERMYVLKNSNAPSRGKNSRPKIPETNASARLNGGLITLGSDGADKTAATGVPYLGGAGSKATDCRQLAKVGVASLVNWPKTERPAANAAPNNKMMNVDIVMTSLRSCIGAG